MSDPNDRLTTAIRKLTRRPADLMARVRKAAREEERAVAQLVRLFIKQGLDQRERKD